MSKGDRLLDLCGLFLVFLVVIGFLYGFLLLGNLVDWKAVGSFDPPMFEQYIEETQWRR